MALVDIFLHVSLLGLYLCFLCKVHASNLPEFYGHEIIERPACMSEDGKYTFLDTNITLGHGILKSFRIFVHNLAENSALHNVKGQVWRPLDNAGAYTLVWQTVLHLEERNRTHVEELQGDHEFLVKAEDKLGFQSDYVACPISMEVSPLGRTYIKKAKPTLVGRTVDDFKGPVPMIFSIGADIIPLPDNPDENGNQDEEESLVNNESLSDQNENQEPEQNILSHEENNIINTNTLLDQQIFSTTRERQEMFGPTQFIGNNLTLADEYWINGGRKVFIDTTFTLNPGVLRSISLYVHSMQGNIYHNEIYLQIWSSYGADKSKFKLEWQKQARFSHGANRVYEFVLPLHEQITVTNKYYLGLANMDHMCPVTFKYSEDGRTLFRKIKRYEGPQVVEEIYHFWDIHEPIFFSIGAYVTPHQTSAEEIVLPEPRRLGHSLIQREYMLPNIPKPKVFVDRNIKLIQGYITKFIVYIGGLVAGISEVPALRFQVWRYRGTAGERDTTHPIYQLRWERSFNISPLIISSRGNRIEMFDVKEEDRIWVDSNDRIGFISEDKLIPIPYDFNNAIGDTSALDYVDLMTLNKTSEGDTIYPHPRQAVYHFDSHPHPITWSLEVEIQPVH